MWINIVFDEKELVSLSRLKRD